MKRNQSRKNNNGNQSVQKQKNAQLLLIPSYPRQVCVDMWIPGTPSVVSTTVTTGVIAFAQTVSNNNVVSFTTRFGSTFLEYRLIQAEFEVRMFSSTNPGLLQAWIDEQSNSTPTLAEAQERAVRSWSAASTDRTNKLGWTATEVDDLGYTAIGSSNIVATFKLYTNNANFGSSIVATAYAEVVPRFRFQFRGLVGV